MCHLFCRCYVSMFVYLSKFKLYQNREVVLSFSSWSKNRLLFSGYLRKFILCLEQDGIFFRMSVFVNYESF